MNHASAFRACLIELDVAAMRRLWRHVSPHLPQPETDADTLMSMHTARVAMRTLPEDLRAYSEAWLKERQTGRIALAVGIAVLAPERRRAQAEYIRETMSRAVTDAIAEGVDLATEPAEIKRRMLAARDKESLPVFPVRSA